MANRKIDEAKEELALKMYSDGLTATQVSQKLGVQLETVSRALKRRGVQVRRGPRRRLSDVLVHEMRLAYEAGKSTTQIAEELGCEATSVQRLLKAGGVQLRPAGFQQGEGHHAWRGGRIVSEDGYVLVLVRPDDPFYSMAQVRTKESRYCLEHRLVMARHLGRLLTDEETVHHVDDRDRQNNALSNLQLRRGNHGKGAALRCADCGSCNIAAEALN